MNPDKLQDETARLRLEVERRQLNWEVFLRRFPLSIVYLILVLSILVFLFSASLNIILIVTAAFLLWEIGNGVKILLELKEARKVLLSWKQIIESAKQ